MTEVDKAELELLKSVDGLLNPSMYVNAIYLSPSESMRQAADNLEKEQAIKYKFKELINRL